MRMVGRESLADVLPQTDGMVLLSGYVPPVSPESVEAWVDITQGSAFFDVEAGGVPGCVALEYMAQAMALSVGLQRRAKALGPKLGFILGSRRLVISVPHFRQGCRYRVYADCTYQDESFGSFDCRILDGQGTVAATAQLTAFQPEDGQYAQEMEKYS